VSLEQRGNPTDTHIIVDGLTFGISPDIVSEYGQNYFILMDAVGDIYVLEEDESIHSLKISSPISSCSPQ